MRDQAKVSKGCLNTSQLKVLHAACFPQVAVLHRWKVNRFAEKIFWHDSPSGSLQPLSPSKEERRVCLQQLCARIVKPHGFNELCFRELLCQCRELLVSAMPAQLCAGERGTSSSLKNQHFNFAGLGILPISLPIPATAAMASQQHLPSCPCRLPLCCRASASARLSQPIPIASLHPWLSHLHPGMVTRKMQPCRRG